MPGSLFGGDLTAMLVALMLVLAAALVASVPGRLLAAWLAMAEFRSGQWVGILLGSCSAMPPVIFSVKLFQSMPLDLLDTRLPRLSVLLGVEAVLVIPLV